MKSKIKSVQSLARALQALRKKNRRARIVFTNGCFDILHAGHVTYLEQAKKQGTHLVVALNADASVKRLKGPSRPINGLADRATVMAAVGAVDFVTWFEEDTPLEAILKLMPDCLVKGGDWRPQQIVGSKEVLGWGGKVRSLKFLEGRSTTSIIEKANRSK